MATTKLRVATEGHIALCRLVKRVTHMCIRSRSASHGRNLSSGPREFKCGSVPPGCLLVVAGMADKATVEDAHQPITDVTERCVVSVSGGPAVVVEGPGEVLTCWRLGDQPHPFKE